ncbi:penicillin acylase family protein [Zavarzinia sp. CC-PAN008]|uniref:penicillin acylase family protein n=1 Tax=Zavarzinia sp. CC-PAN008 TaxID=3243332 RepID=UPI003F74809E
MAAVSLARAAAVLWAGLIIAGCAALTPLPPPSRVADRINRVPDGLPVTAPVTIHWSPEKIPFIEAQTDADAAMALGLVHAHLRLGQMELLRRISQGRISEVAGPFTTDIDRALRILNLGKASPTVLAQMPQATRAWLDAFVAGVNYYQANMADRPHEYALFGARPVPWRPEEIITIGRLASVDVTWFTWFRLLPERTRADWPAVWARLLESGTTSAPSFPFAPADPDPQGLAMLEDVLGGSARTGSNAFAVGGSRTASGAAIVANDPHLGLRLPNAWMIAGVKSPSMHAVGLMIPGLPFVAVGRNERIAWGGTNLRAASSDLFDVSALPPSQITEREEEIKVRWWLDTSQTVRETPFGPIISDSAMVQGQPGEQLAVSWIGHRPSDEITAMLGVGRARNFDEFRRALDGFSLSPQNMVYGDVDGHVGQVTATHLPSRSLTPPADIVRPVADAKAWERIVTGRDLPWILDPPGGYVATANNMPGRSSVPIGYFFSSDDRIGRLTELLSGNDTVDAARLAAIQQDVTKPSAARLRDRLVARLDGLVLEPGPAAVAARVRAFDGSYRADDAAPVAFEATVFHLIEALYAPDARRLLSAAGRLFDALDADLARMPPEQVDAALATALDKAQEAVGRFPTWGDMHRIGLAGWFGAAPLIGGRYRFGDVPASGSSETLLKTSHELTDQRHEATFGADARLIADLSDLDATQVVLLGGQDGWYNSEAFLDQVKLFQEGRFIRLPMRLETVRANAAYRTEILPPRPGS